MEKGKSRIQNDFRHSQQVISNGQQSELLPSSQLGQTYWLVISVSICKIKTKTWFHNIWQPNRYRWFNKFDSTFKSIYRQCASNSENFQARQAKDRTLHHTKQQPSEKTKTTHEITKNDTGNIPKDWTIRKSNRPPKGYKPKQESILIPSHSKK